ncbi:hypothetical protein GCM10009872_39860 [Actinopolymorpha rutila]
MAWRAVNELLAAKAFGRRLAGHAHRFAAPLADPSRVGRRRFRRSERVRPGGFEPPTTRIRRITRSVYNALTSSFTTKITPSSPMANSGRRHFAPHPAPRTSLWEVRLATRPADEVWTFGLKRAEILSSAQAGAFDPEPCLIDALLRCRGWLAGWLA